MGCSDVGVVCIACLGLGGYFVCVCVCKLGHDVGGGGRGVLILERQVGTRF